MKHRWAVAYEAGSALAVLGVFAAWFAGGTLGPVDGEFDWTLAALVFGPFFVAGCVLFAAGLILDEMVTQATRTRQEQLWSDDGMPPPPPPA